MNVLLKLYIGNLLFHELGNIKVIMKSSVCMSVCVCVCERESTLGQFSVVLPSEILLQPS